MMMYCIGVTCRKNKCQEKLAIKNNFTFKLTLTIGHFGACFM